MANDGMTALMKAVSKPETEENIRAVLKLIHEGEDVNALNSNNESTLEIALRAGHLKFVIALVDAGADINAKDKNGFTALMYHSMCADIKETKLLIELGADVNDRNKDGDTALILSTSIPVKEAADTIILLVNSSASINEVNNNGETALMSAVRSRNMAQTQTLLDLEADTSIKNHDGKTVFDLAQEYYSEDIANLLADKVFWRNHGHTIAKSPILIESGEMSF